MIDERVRAEFIRDGRDKKRKRDFNGIKNRVKPNRSLDSFLFFLKGFQAAFDVFSLPLGGKHSVKTYRL